MEEHSLEPGQSAMIGTREIALAVLFGDDALAGGYFPPLWRLWQGRVGRFFSATGSPCLRDHGVAVYLVYFDARCCLAISLRHSKDVRSARRKRMRPIFAMAFRAAIWWFLGWSLRHRLGGDPRNRRLLGSLYFLLPMTKFTYFPGTMRANLKWLANAEGSNLSAPAQTCTQIESRLKALRHKQPAGHYRYTPHGRETPRFARAGDRRTSTFHIPRTNAWSLETPKWRKIRQ